MPIEMNISLAEIVDTSAKNSLFMKSATGK